MKDVRQLAIYIVLLWCSVSTVSCSSSRVVAESTVIHIPPLGEVATAELGDPIIYKLEGRLLPALRLLEPVSAVKNFAIRSDAKLEVVPGTLEVVAQNDEEIRYKSADQIVWNGEPSNYRGGVIISRIGKAPKMYVDGVLKPIEVEPFRYEQTYRVEELAPQALRQELVYTGTDGTSLKFIYREYLNDLARPAFTQEAQYDLAMGDTIGFKGSRFKIIEADNAQIKYVPLSNFP